MTADGTTADRLATNRAHWDDRTDVHLRSRFYDVEGWLRDATGPRRSELEALGDVSGLRLVHLQCHFGLDTLAWARAGAQVTGVDFSPAAIDAARHIAARAGLEQRAEFVCADVDQAADALDHDTFDVVYVSFGALCWLPSVRRWAEQVGALTAPGGRVYLHDGHPLAWALAEDGHTLGYSYFEEDEPFVDDSATTYTDAERPLRSRRSYEWNHGVGEVVTALIDAGLRIDRLTEHDWTVQPRFDWLVPNTEGNWTSPPGTARLALSFTVLASRPQPTVAE